MYDNLSKEMASMVNKVRINKAPPWGPIVEIKKPEPVRFGGDPVIESFKLDELLAAKAKGKRICDFLPAFTFSKPNQRYLQRWKAWFQFQYTFRGYTKKVNPYAVTKGKIYRLWKIWEGMSDKEMKEINEGISWKKGG